MVTRTFVDGMSRSVVRTLLLALTLGWAGFFLGQQHTIEATQTICDLQCGYTPCSADPPPAGCGMCGQWIHWVEIYNAGPNCISCGTGFCRWLAKVDIDHCAQCHEAYVEQCLSCIP